MRRIREALGLSQAEIGRVLGVHAVTVSRWETGAAAVPGFQAGLLRRFKKAVGMRPQVREAVREALKGESVQALYLLLQASQ